jgi:hypothetical protein
MRVPIDSTIKANIVADVVSVGCVLRGTKLKTGAKKCSAECDFKISRLAESP